MLTSIVLFFLKNENIPRPGLLKLTLIPLYRYDFDKRFM